MVNKPHEVRLKITGDGCKELFSSESGGHRWQRVPPNDNRVHSSTVTVAVMGELNIQKVKVKPNDVEIKDICGSGPGGQKINKTASTIQIKHIPTGLIIKCQAERKQSKNREKAMRLLQEKLDEKNRNSILRADRDDRRNKVGSGERGDKIRTVQMQNGLVINHSNNRRMSVKDYLKGKIEKIV